MPAMLSKTAPSTSYVKFGSFGHLRESNLTDNKTEYIATEKIHGASFSLTITPNGIYAGKKINWVEFNAKGEHKKSIQFPFEEPVMSMADGLFKIRTELGVEKVIFYCELYGNFVNSKHLQSSVQREILYTKNLTMKLIVFAAKCGGVFIPFYKLKDLCGRFNVPIVPIIYEGTLTEIWNQPREFKSKISELDEYAEGIVIIDPNNPSKRFKKVSDRFRLIHKVAKPKTKNNDKELLRDCINNIDHYIFNDSKTLGKILASYGGSENSDERIAVELIKDVFQDYIEEHSSLEYLSKQIKKNFSLGNIKRKFVNLLMKEGIINFVSWRAFF